MNERNLTTILAALRYWQEQTKSAERAQIMPEHFLDVRPLSDSEIDKLCEDLCCTEAR